MKDRQEREILRKIHKIRNQLNKHSVIAPLSTKTPPGSNLEEMRKQSVLRQRREDLLSKLKKIRASKSD